MVPPPFRDKVRVLPSAESSHFSIAGCHFAIPQKSPTFAHMASGESFEAALALDSSAWAVSPDSNSAAPAATAVLIPIMSLPSSCVCSIGAEGCNIARMRAPDKIERPTVAHDPSLAPLRYLPAFGLRGRSPQRVASLLPPRTAPRDTGLCVLQTSPSHRHYP